MMKRVKKWWRQHRLRRRLEKMEKALLLHLTPMQRALVLDPQPPRELERWPRRFGKTTCACLHLLLHAPLTACYSKDKALQLLPDPDARKTVGMNMVIYDQLYHMGGREQPLLMMISTMGTVLDGPLTYYYGLFTDAMQEGMLEQSVADSMFTFICELDSEAEINDPELLGDEPKGRACDQQGDGAAA